MCMTHADLRYNECMDREDGNPEPTLYKIQEIGADLMVHSADTLICKHAHIRNIPHDIVHAEEEAKNYTPSFSYSGFLLFLFATWI